MRYPFSVGTEYTISLVNNESFEAIYVGKISPQPNKPALDILTFSSDLFQYHVVASSIVMVSTRVAGN